LNIAAKNFDASPSASLFTLSKGKRPGIVVVHEWWGITKHVHNADSPSIIIARIHLCVTQ
jgi:dienelactone hydrolase